MKKLLSVLISAVFLFMIFIPTYAANDICDKEYFGEKEYFDDGSYVIEVLGDMPSKENENDNLFIRILELFKKIISFITGKKTITKTKYVYYYGSDDSLLWVLYLTAEFTYSKNYVVCNKATVSSRSYDADWKVISAVSSKSDNIAKGDFTVRQTKLAVSLKTISKTITMTCDKNGKIK